MQCVMTSCRWQYVLCHGALAQVENVATRIEGICKCATMIRVGWDKDMTKEKIGAQNDGECHHF
jgi:hypothetical protein